MTESELDADIRPLEGELALLTSMRTLMDSDGMLLPPLCTQSDYVQYAKDAGLKIHTEPLDISKEVSKTWYVVSSTNAT